LLVNTADGSDAEAVGTTQLARIDEEAARPEIAIEIFKSEVRILRMTKRSDDVASSPANIRQNHGSAFPFATFHD